jgi:hypothetical protein
MPRTGKVLWADSRRWGSWRIVAATKDLMDEFRGEMETSGQALERRGHTWVATRCSRLPSLRVRNAGRGAGEEGSVIGCGSRRRARRTRLAVSSTDPFRISAGARSLVVGLRQQNPRLSRCGLPRRRPWTWATCSSRPNQFEFDQLQGPAVGTRSTLRARSKDKKILIEYRHARPAADPPRGSATFTSLQSSRPAGHDATAAKPSTHLPAGAANWLRSGAGPGDERVRFSRSPQIGALIHQSGPTAACGWLPWEQVRLRFRVRVRRGGCNWWRSVD